MSHQTTETHTAFTVLGGRGFIGSHLVRYLEEQGHECFVPARDDDTVLQRPLGHVIYAIGMTADFRSRPLETVDAHVCFLRRLLQAGNFDSLTYLSSTRVYAGATDTSENATLRVNPNDPGDLYNLSKLMGESICLHGGRQNTKVLRLSNIVGLRPDSDIFIDQLLEEGCRTGKVLFRTSSESRKDYLWIGDAVELTARIAVSPHNGVFNVASGEGVSNGEIAEAMRSAMGFDIAFATDAATWGFTEITISRAKLLFGFSPKKFAEYFPPFLQSYRQKKGL